MTYNEAETRFHLIDPVLRAKGYDDHQRIKLETPAPVEPTGPMGRRRKGKGRTDYLLCVQVGTMPKSLPVAVLEAKRETEDPLKGMQQAKGYADCSRHDVKYVFATNGHRYGEFDTVTGLQGGPFPFPDFPHHGDLTARYAKDSGIDLSAPESAMLFMADSPAYPQSRYYQDAAIRAAFEKIIHCRQHNEPAHVLLSMATGSGKTIIAANLLWRLHEARMLPKPALFLCDRDELRTQAYNKIKAVFGDNARIVQTRNGKTTYGALFENAPPVFDVILTNPPFGGKEGKDAQKNFSFETGSTQVLFLQDILKELATGGRCGIVLDEGLLFRTNESAFVETKRKLVDECDLWAIVSLPGGVFTTAGAGVKTNLLFFTKGRPTKKIWYYDLTHIKMGKKSPMTLAHFGFSKEGRVLDDSELPATLTGPWLENEENKGKRFPTFARMLVKRGKSQGESSYSWTIDFTARRAKAREEMAPHLAEVEKLKIDIIEHKEKLKVLKKEKAADETISTLTETIKALEKSARDAQAKADAIDAAVYDLKAVNSNAVAKVDTRTPQEIIESIESQGRIVEEALEKLKALLVAKN